MGILNRNSGKGIVFQGQLRSNCAREGEFAGLTTRETGRIERIFNDVFTDCKG